MPEPTPSEADRLRGLRYICGYHRLRDFAAALDRPGLGVDTLGDVERGERELSPEERIVITDFCGVGRDWFETPRWMLGTPAGERASIEQRIDTLQRAQDATLEELQALRRMLGSDGPLEDLLAATQAARELDEPRG